MSLILKRFVRVTDCLDVTVKSACHSFVRLDGLFWRPWGALWLPAEAVESSANSDRESLSSMVMVVRDGASGTLISALARLLQEGKLVL